MKRIKFLSEPQIKLITQIAQIKKSILFIVMKVLKKTISDLRNPVISENLWF